MDKLEENVCVALLYRKEVVAFGHVFSVEPTQRCHLREIGTDKSVVIVSKVFKMDCPLPYPHGDFDHLQDIYNNSMDAMANRLLWDNTDIVKTHELVIAECPVYNIDDVVDCMDFRGVVVSSARFKGYHPDESHLLARVKLLSITTEGSVVNATSEDGNPFYTPNQSMIWCLSKLSSRLLVSRCQKQVSINEAMNECFTYYCDSYAKLSYKRKIALKCNQNYKKACSTAPVYNSDVLTGVEDVVDDLMFRPTYNSDVLTGVEDVVDDLMFRPTYNSDVLTGVDDVADDDMLNVRSTYNTDVLTGVEDVDANVNNRMSRKRSFSCQAIGERTSNIQEGLVFKQSKLAPRASVMASANASTHRNSDFSVYDFDELDDIDNGHDMIRKSTSTDKDWGTWSQQESFENLERESQLPQFSRASRGFRRKRVIALVPPKKSEIVLSSQNIRETLMQPCCKKLCIRQVTYKECEDLRLGVWRKRGSDKHNHLLQMFACFLKMLDKPNVACNAWEETKLCFKPTIAGKATCSKAYQDLLGLSHGMFWQIIAEARNNIVHKLHGNTGTFKQRKHSAQGLAVMRGMLEKHALPQPHLQHTSKNGVVHCEHHLPLGMRKGDIFKSINTQLKDLCMSTVSIPTLYRMWSREFRHVKTPTKQRMSKCKICDDLKNVIETTFDARVRDRYIAMRCRHLHHVFDSRKLYTYWKEESRSHPEQSLCLIIDGMDQNTTTLPRFKRTPPRLEGNRFLKTHVCGVLVHGFKLLCDVWIDTLHLHDSNQVATSIMRAIRKVQVARGTLPPILRIQADNCWRENKNKFIFGLCSMLVAHNIFQMVEVGFLMVGHTHEDIDQVFSVISRVLKSNSVLTMPDMLARIGQKIGGGRTETSDVELLERMTEWKGFIDPCIARGNDGLEGHTNPHYFRFQRLDGDPVMQWKYYSNDGDDSWSEPFKLLKSLPSIDEPIFLAPTKDLDTDEVKGIIAFIEYTRYMSLKYPEYKEKNAACVDETTKLLEYLSKQKNLPASLHSQAEFWPETMPNTFKSNNGSIASGADNEVQMDAELLPRRYCGRKGDAPLSEFTPSREVSLDKFVAIRPPDEAVAEGAPVWIAKVVEVENDIEGMAITFKALWYEPKSNRRRGCNELNNKDLYKNCLLKEWVPNNDGLQDVNVDAVIFAWKSKAKKSTKKHGYIVEKSISIPDISTAHIKEYLLKLGDECAADVDD